MKKRDEELPLSDLPVSPSTGLDPEVRQFFSRVMAGYEAAHRTIADMAELMAKSASEAQSATTRAIQFQVKLAEEREELISKRHRRDLEAMAAKQRQEAIGELSTDVRSVLKLAAKKFMGIPLTGNDSHGLTDLLSTMTGEQIEALMTSGTLQLSPGQRQLLASTLTSLAESEAKKTPPAELPEAAE